jgi:hypothetical protein
MTKLEEFAYLSDIVLQASLWRCEKDEGRTPIELEVLDRMARLKKELDLSSEQKEKIAAERRVKSNEYRQKWAEGKIRVDGHWYPKDQCVQAPRKDGHGWKWVLKTEASDDGRTEEA